MTQNFGRDSKLVSERNLFSRFKTAGGNSVQYRPVSSWFFPHPVAWIGGLILLLIAIVWAYLAGFTIEFGSTYKKFTYAAMLVVLGMALSKRKMDFPAITVFTLAFFMFFGKLANVLNYLSHAIGMPMADARLAQLEIAMGIDWLAMLEFFNSYPKTSSVVFMIYNLLTLWTIATAVSLLLMGMYERLREFVFLFAITLLITIFIGTFFPAGGAFYYYQPSPEIMDNLSSNAGRFFLEQLIAVHDGSQKTIVLDRVVGLITFPSFHMVMAVLICWAMRRTALFWPYAVLSLIIAISTPVFGGHYMPDLVAGAAVAIVAIFAYYQWSGRKMGAPVERMPIKLLAST